MLWFSVWTLLVLGTLGGAFVLGRRLYRSGRALARELERAAEVAELLADKVDELSAAAQAASALAPVDLVDPTAARERLAQAELATERRRAARLARREATMRRWWAFSH